MNETDGTVTLTVSLIDGKISEGKHIPVRVTTADDSAQGKLETMSYEVVDVLLLIFNLQLHQITCLFLKL